VVLTDAVSGTEIDLGTAPEGATELFVASRCVDAGRFVWIIDGRQSGGIRCDGPGGGGAGGLLVPLSGRQTLTVESAPSGRRFDLWASWSAPPVLPEPSAAQSSALADGIVTEAEYRDGFDRYSRCMTDAGFPVQAIDDTPPVISYVNSGAAVDSGAEAQCYAAEFEQLDMQWRAGNR
jgi:hypothetical protein